MHPSIGSAPTSALKAGLAPIHVRYPTKKFPMPREKIVPAIASSARMMRRLCASCCSTGGVWGKTFHTTAFSAFLSHDLAAALTFGVLFFLFEQTGGSPPNTQTAIPQSESAFSSSAAAAIMPQGIHLPVSAGRRYTRQFPHFSVLPPL